MVRAIEQLFINNCGKIILDGLTFEHSLPISTNSRLELTQYSPIRENFRYVRLVPAIRFVERRSF